MKEKIMGFLFPPRCSVCAEVLAMEERGGVLCGNCRKETKFFRREVCPHCGGETENAGFCASCLQGFSFDFACAAIPYETVRTAIRLFKYDGDKTIGYGLGEMMAEYLLEYQKELPAKVDVMVAVPLHPKKEKFRGFNQTHILCEKISDRTGILFQKDALVRERETIAQSELSPDERKINLKDAFAASADFIEKTVLLVDDIFTTGTTSSECARELYRAGAKEVFVFALSAAGTK